jgi:hypothetical protein
VRASLLGAIFHKRLGSPERVSRWRTPSERQAANDDICSSILQSPGYFVADIKLAITGSCSTTRQRSVPVEASVVSALIAATVSAVGVAVGLYSSRHQLRTKMAELELKRQEIDKLGVKLKAEAEAIRQNLMRDVVAKRMSAYAALWRVFITYERNWSIEQKPFDVAWATAFLLAVNECNAEHGVFFSEAVYKPFFEYRARLVEIIGLLKAGKVVGNAELKSLTEVSSVGVPGRFSALATAMKDDLGSYMRVAIQA